MGIIVSVVFYQSQEKKNGLKLQQHVRIFYTTVLTK